MSPSAAEIWRGVLSELEKGLSPHQFHTWFQNVAIQRIEGDLVVLSVPNLFTRDWITDNYYHLLQNAFAYVTGSTPKVELAVDASLASAAKTVPVPEQNPAPVRQAGILSEIQLNTNYTFTEFVVGPSNRLPHAAALAVAENPAHAYNPLFLHGAVGLGKTHLLQAICHELIAKRPQMRILYLSCESFVNHFIAAIQRGELQRFRYRYRDVDALIIDDIHFLAHKEQTQEEFFHTFNTLYQTKRQIVLSSDSPPSEIPSLENRLVSRFKMGLVTKIEPPVFETRVAILKQKSRLRGLDVDDSALQFIAERIDTNIRELEGAINILSVEARARQTSQITVDLVRSALHDFLPSQPSAITIGRIIETVVEEYGVKFGELQSKKRAKSIAFPRQVCMFLAKKLTNSSLAEIGSYFGGRDHSTVIYAIDKIEGDSKEDPALAATLSRLTRRLQSGV
mgnify:FL=1